MKVIKNNLFILSLIFKIAPLRVIIQIFEMCFSFSYGAFYTLIFFRTIINSIEQNTPFINKDKTVLFISHRLSTTKGADKIYVLDNGIIAESGTHDELIKLEKIYYKMWEAQAKNYKYN